MIEYMDHNLRVLLFGTERADKISAEELVVKNPFNQKIERFFLGMDKRNLDLVESPDDILRESGSPR